MHPALTHTGHRPWPVPQRPWALRMRWCDLAFVHWEIDPAELRKRIPEGLEPDLYDGRGWIGVVPFNMLGVAPRLVPAVPPLSDFPEINVRTYVVRDGKPGVWFFSLDVPSRPAVWSARTFFHLPYYHARMSVGREDGRIHYLSERGAFRFHANYRGTGKREFPSGSFARWATERYCLYSQASDGRIFRGEVHHRPWPIESAEMEIRRNTMLGDLPVGAQHPEVLYSRSLDVVAWTLDRCQPATVSRD